MRRLRTFTTMGRTTMNQVSDAVVGRAERVDETAARLSTLVTELEHQLAVQEQRLAELGERARWVTHLQKMETVALLVGGLVHDLKNMHCVIQGYSDLGIRDAAPDSALAHYFERIGRASAHAVALLGRLIDYSRRRESTLATMDLNRVVEQLVPAIRRLIGKRITVETALPLEPLWVRANRGCVEQIIVNLAINARDAMPLGGVLLIETGRKEDAEREEDTARGEDGAEGKPETRNPKPDRKGGLFLDSEGKTPPFLYRPLSTDPSARHCPIRLTIQDTGYGIPPEVLPRVFEPYFTTKDEGAGLGLAFAQRLVEDLDGGIEAKSEPGKGTRFDISLPPADTTEAEPMAKPFDELRGLTGHGERVLVVEDDEAVREFVVEALEETGYKVLPAADGAETLAILHRQKGHPAQAMIIDMLLPDTDVFELAERIRGVWGPVPVVVQTGYKVTEQQKELIKEKGFQLLRKPCTLSQLLSTVRAALGGK